MRGKVRDITAELEKKQLADLRKKAEKTGRREVLQRVEMLETLYELADMDVDAAVAELASVGNAEADDAAAGLRSARALLTCMTGDVAGGLSEWEAVMAAYPAAAEPYIMRGRWRLQNGDDAEGALADLGRAVALDPNGANGYRWRAQAFEKIGDAERALANHRRAASLAPDDVDLALGLAQALTRYGAHDEALAAWKRLVVLEPKSLDFWYELSKAEQTAPSGTMEGMLAACNGAIECAPTLGRLYFDRTKIREELGESSEDDDLRDYDLALANGCRLADVFVNKSDNLARRSQLKDAIATLDIGAAEHPEDGWIYTWRAEFKRRLGDAEGARADDVLAKRFGSWSIAEAHDA